MPIAIVVPGFVVFVLTFGLYCRACGVHVDFLRAESAWVLVIAFWDKAHLAELVQRTMLHSYNGHYIPIAIAFELLQSRLFGPRESLWFWRQMVVAGGLGTAIACSAYCVARFRSPSRLACAVTGLALAILFIYQPAMLELVSWPFMAMQLIALTLVALSIVFLCRFLEGNLPRDLGFFLLSAYGSMQFFGVGLAFSSASLLVGSAVVIVKRSDHQIDAQALRSCIRILACICVVTILHALAMLHGPASVEPATPFSVARATARFGQLFIDSLTFGTKALWANDGFPMPVLQVKPDFIDAVYGAGSVVIAVGLCVALFCRYLQSPDKLSGVTFSVVSLSVLSLVSYVGMTVIRLNPVASEDAILPFLIGTRYLIFQGFFVVLCTIGVLPLVWSLLGRFSPALFSVLAITAIVGTYIFSHSLMPTVWPGVLIDSQSVWDDAVARARRERAHGDLLTRTAFPQLNPEFPINLYDMRMLLEHDLGCSNCAHFKP